MLWEDVPSRLVRRARVSGDALSRRSNGQVWLRPYLLVASVLCTVYVALPDPPRSLWTAIGLLSLAGLVGGTLMNRPRYRWPWWLTTAGVATLMLGDATYDLLTGPLGQDNPFPSWADAFYLAMYPLLASGLLALVRVTNRHGDTAAAIDAAVVTIALGLVVWVYVGEPYAEDPALTLPQKLVSVAYPLGDILILAMLVRLLIGGRSRCRALWFLSVGTAGLFVSDVLYGLLRLTGSWATGGAVDVGWMVFYVAWGAAALSPDMTDLTEPARIRARSTAGHRLLLLTLVPLAAPALQLWGIAHGASSTVPVTAAASAILFVLVAQRLRGLLSEAERATGRETAMRRTGEAFVAASDAAAVFQVAARALHDITEHPSRLLVATGSPLRIVFDSSGGGLPNADELGDLLRRHEDSLRSRQFVLTTAQRCGPALSSALGGGEPLLIAAMLRGYDVTGLLLVSGEQIDRPENIDQICALASQTRLAIDGIELTSQVAQRRSEAHFRSLIQHATDLILVVDSTMTLRYSTPSARRVLGWDPDDGRPRPIEELVVPEDAARARLLLRRVFVGDPLAGDPHAEWRLVDRDGAVRVFEVSCQNLVEDPNVRGIVVTLHDITDRRQLESDLKHQAFHDSLTQLPNRALFLDRVGHALALSRRRREQLAVLLVDLDNFKVINDTRGHAAGDTFLREVGQRLLTTLRAGDSCARLGGDEFAILAEGVATDEEAAQFADRLIEQLRAPFDIGHESVSASASVGISTSRHANDAPELLRQADLAMYAAKDAGKGGWQLFRSELIDEMRLRARTATQLDRAVEREEFRLHYQPIVNIDSGAVVGLEALLRWEHPQRGLLAPGEFIHILEESNLAVPVGAWVIDQAIAQGAAWQRFAPRNGVLKMTVNVAPRELAHPEFVGNVVHALDCHGLPARALVLEITERILAGHDAATDQAMADLRELGVLLAVDDFGTGYAALGYLRRFPVSTLKIDRSFIAGLCTSPDDHALVEAIIGLGETFHFDLVAEGVETERQRVELLRLGCPHAQGFHYSGPMPTRDAEAYLTGTAS